MRTWPRHHRLPPRLPPEAADAARRRRERATREVGGDRSPTLRLELKVSFDNRREYYRIPFPQTERPRVVVGLSISEVIECSERGLSYRPAAEVGGVGEVLEGRIRFPRGVELPIRGEVVRVADDRVALSLKGAGIPFAVIFQEQLHLRRGDR